MSAVAMYVAAIVTALLIGYAHAQDPDCDFSQNVEVGVTYYIYNPNYPDNYSPDSQCRWQAVCPTGYNCRLDCNDIAIPQSESCSMDRLLISRTGDPQLAQADRYCGTGTISVVSIGQSISIGFISEFSSTGGRFLCELTAQSDTPDSSCMCGYRRLDRIVGGEAASPTEFPMMAGIVYEDQDGITCGAVIIDRIYVLTAAHCVIDRPLSELEVVVGEYNTSSGADSPATQEYRVASYLTHPQYTSANYDYDIAILRIEGEMVYSDFVAPVCLPFKFINYDFAGEIVTVVGWGTLFPGGPTSDVLMKVDLDVISQETCRNSIPDVTPRQMCTFTPGRDACQDDSGGPLLYTDPQTGLLFHAGIVSYGRFCASADPGVNTRVTSVLDWIVTNAPANYCRK